MTKTRTPESITQPDFSRSGLRLAKGGREPLLRIAERMISENGVKGTSLRQIAAEAGQGNTSVIQYHFGDKAGLLREIISWRLAGLEERRQYLLDEATARDRLSDMRSLLEIIFLPIGECTDDRGHHAYARFIMQFMTIDRYEVGVEHPGWGVDSAANRAGNRLAACLPFLDLGSFEIRLVQVGAMFFNALVERDNAIDSGRPVCDEATFFDDLFAMMTAAISVERPKCRVIGLETIDDNQD